MTGARQWLPPALLTFLCRSATQNPDFDRRDLGDGRIFFVDPSPGIQMSIGGIWVAGALSLQIRHPKSRFRVAGFGRRVGFLCRSVTHSPDFDWRDLGDGWIFFVDPPPKIQASVCIYMARDLVPVTPPLWLRAWRAALFVFNPHRNLDFNTFKFFSLG